MRDSVMALFQLYHEEDMFPREICSHEKRHYGILFYDEDNKDSYDSNHAVIFENNISDLYAVLEDIISFYRAKGVKAVIYQSAQDEGLFERISDK